MHEPGWVGAGEPSPDLRQAISRLWVDFRPDGTDGIDGFGLVPELPFDAVLARARSNTGDRSTEGLLCVPRLLELLVGHDLSVIEARQAMQQVVAVETLMSTDQRLSVQQVLESWWLQSLKREVGEQTPGFPPPVVLGLVARWPSPMTRWLTPWLEQLDGPGAKYLVDTIAALELSVLDAAGHGEAADVAPWRVMVPLLAEAWRGVDDAKGQLLSWARSETVVNGLVLIGAVHLHSDHYPELLSDVLDLLLEG